MKSMIIPGFGIIADFGLSGANCLFSHVSTIIIEKRRSENYFERRFSMK
ncbi:hypothetical protein [Lactiplantibacillus paraxiangfangensis]